MAPTQMTGYSVTDWTVILYNTIPEFARKKSMLREYPTLDRIIWFFAVCCILWVHESERCKVKGARHSGAK